MIKKTRNWFCPGMHFLMSQTSSRLSQSSARTQASKGQLKLESDSTHYEEDLLEDLFELVGSLKNEISTLSGSSLALVGGSDCSASFCFQTKEGIHKRNKRTLLHTSCKSTASCNYNKWSLNVERLELPKESCASYMNIKFGTQCYRPSQVWFPELKLRWNNEIPEKATRYCSVCERST